MSEANGGAPRSRLHTIGIFTETYSPIVGGAERLLETLVQSVSDMGIEAKVAVPRGAVEGHRTGPEVSLAPARRTPLGWFVRPRWLRAWLERNECQVMLTSGPSLIEWAAIPGAGRSIPSVSLYHADLDRTKGISRVANGAHVRLLLPRFDAVVTTSPIVAASLTARQPRLTPHVILPGVTVGGSEERPKGRDVLFIGRLPESHAQKRPDLLLRAFGRAADRIPTSRLHMVGDGPGRANLETIARDLGISDRTTFHGYVTEDEKGSIFRLAGCLVLPSPSTSEGFGLVNLEAVHHHIPIVVSEGAGGAFVVEQTGIGNLFEPDDETSLADTIVTTIDEHVQGKFDTLYDAANRKFSTTAMADGYVALWDRLLDRKTR